MRVISITFVDLPSVEGAGSSGGQRRRVKKGQSSPVSDTTAIAERPFNERFYREIIGEPDHIPIVFDETLGADWQKKLR